MATPVKNGQKTGKRKSTESSSTKDSTTSKKRKSTESSLTKDSTSSKKRKHFHGKASTSEVVTMDESDIDEHTRLLSSVTGKMARLPMHEEDGLDDREEETEGGTKETSPGGEEREGSGKEEAARYLALWNSQRDQWTFRKKTQYWLLQNMYDKKKVSKANFKLCLLYLDGLRGNQRGLAKERAEKVVAKDHLDKESKIKYKRACQVLRTLTTQ